MPSSAEYMLWAALDPADLEPEGKELMEALDQGKLAEARAHLAFEVECRAGAEAAGISPAEYMLQAAAEDCTRITSSAEYMEYMEWGAMLHTRQLGVLFHRGKPFIVDEDCEGVRAIRHLEKHYLYSPLPRDALNYVKNLFSLPQAAVQYLENNVADVTDSEKGIHILS